jgi:hypothetical protein
LKKESLLIFVFAVAVTGLWAWFEFRRPDRPAANPTESKPAQYAEYYKLGDDRSEADKLTWGDVPKAASYLSDRALQTGRFLDQSADAKRPEAVYLRGLILLARNQPGDAAKAFCGIGPEKIPPTLLYAPWRLFGEWVPGEANPFEGPLFQAADEGLLPPLVAARVFSAKRRFDKALVEYLKGDPSMWTSRDLDCFRLMLADEDTKKEAGTVLLAAFKKGRIPDGLKPSAATLILGETGNKPTTEMLRDFIAKNPDAAAVAEETIRSLTDDRRLFIEKKFAELVAKHRGDRLESQIDESAILLTIASASAGDTEAFARWSGELQRRFPQKDVAAWIQSLANP